MRGLTQRREDAPELLGDGADLRLGGDQRRGQYQRIAHGAEHKILLEEGGLERAGAAQTRRTVDRGEVDAGGKPDAADIDDAGAPFNACTASASTELSAMARSNKLSSR